MGSLVGSAHLLAVRDIVEVEISDTADQLS
jgi:hypothetical protein